MDCMTKELQAWKESLKEYLNEGHGTKVKGHIPKRHIFLIWSIFLSNIKLMGCKAKELWVRKGSWKFIQMVVRGSKVKGQSKVATLKGTSTWYDIYPCQIWNWSAAQPRYCRLEKEAGSTYIWTDVAPRSKVNQSSHLQKTYLHDIKLIPPKYESDWLHGKATSGRKR